MRCCLVKCREPDVLASGHRLVTDHRVGLGWPTALSCFLAGAWWLPLRDDAKSTCKIGHNEANCWWWLVHVLVARTGHWPAVGQLVDVFR